MLRPPSPSKPEQATTDLGAVEAALADLERNGLLSAEDRRAMRAAIGR
jgi:hypothetical protein